MGDIDFWTIITQIINFWILFFLFRKVLAKPLNKLVEERNALVQKLQNFDEYSQSREQALQLKEKLMTDEARAKARDIITQAEAISQKKATEIIDKANNDVKMILEWGKRQVEKERFQMIEDSRVYIMGLAMKINKKLLWDQSVSEELIQEELKKM